MFAIPFLFALGAQWFQVLEPGAFDAPARSLAELEAPVQEDREEAEPADTAVQFSASERRRILKLSPVEAAPLDSTNRFDGNPDAERFGQRLFWDKRFSANGEVSCATCHDPEQEFSDGLPVGKGLAIGTRRTPSLWNVTQNDWFFHDGRADSLWSQALGPLENPIEMGTDRLAVLHVIAGDPYLRGWFEALAGSLPEMEDTTRFPAHARPDPEEPETEHHRAWLSMSEPDRAAVNRCFSDVGKFIAAFERQLVKLDSPFDRFVANLKEGTEIQAEFPSSAQRGLRLFLGKGKCRLCHNGPNFTDGEFHALGLGPRGGGMPSDSGRYGGLPKLEASEFRASGPWSDDPEGDRAQSSTGLARDPANWGEFKTPSLRNVIGRGPYMHAGQFETLADTLQFYSTLEGAAPLHGHQEQVLEARDFTEGELVDLEEFLRSLQGVPPAAEWISPPTPPSGPK